jgi:acyl-CoA reductase-like NAD-dependent aldehyde dehydrogenase
MEDQSPEAKTELNKTLAAASPMVMERSQDVFEQVPDIIQQTIQALQQFQPGPPPIPVDPNQAAETERKAADDQRKDATKRLEIQTDVQVDFAKLSAEERQRALEAADKQAEEANKRAARLRELMLTEAAEDERVAARLASDELRNTQDNETALTIAAAELEAGEKTDLSTGTGINPSGG